MQSCTECGTPISPAVGPPVLLNGKVVCQPCWQKVEAETASAPAGSSRPTSQPGSRLSSRAAASSASRRQTSTTPASRRSSGREAPTPPPSRSDRSTSRTARTSRDEAEHGPRATSRTATLIEEVESSTSGERMKIYIIILMCVMVLAAGIAGFMWHSKTTRDKDEAERADKEAAAAMDTVKGLVAKNATDFPTIRKAIDEAKPKVKDFLPRRNELSNIESEIINSEQNAQTRAANLKLLEDVKKDIDDTSKRAAVRVMLDRLRAVANGMDKPFQEEVTKLGQKLTLNTLKEGVDAAKAKEAAGDLTGALAAYDDAIIKFNKQFDSEGGRASTPDILNLYKELIAESDKLVDRVETPEYEAQTPDRDMLSAKERGAWGKTDGIELNWAARELEIKGVDTGKKITGVADMGLSRTNPWSDIVLDINFTIVSGKFEMYLRYFPGKPNFLLSFGPEAGYELNKAYQVTIRVKGSKVEMSQPDQNPQTDNIKTAVNRTGGIGFGLNPGTKLIISSCKVKVLRPKV